MENIGISESIIIGFLGVTLFHFLEVLVTNRSKLVEDGKEAIKEQFEVYQNIYLKICKNQFGEEISRQHAAKEINKLIYDIENSNKLFILLSPQLMNWLLLYKKNNSIEIKSIQFQIELDFDRLSTKLGYLSKYKNSLFITFFPILFLITIIVGVACSSSIGKDYIIPFSLIFVVLLSIEILYFLINEPAYRLTKLPRILSHFCTHSKAKQTVNKEDKLIK